MDIIPIGSKKIKISLTKTDIEKYRLDLTDMDYKSTGTRKAFWSILDDVKRESGFDAAKSRILVQVFTSPAGGCEMFVTSVYGKEDDQITCEKDPVALTDLLTYRFESLDALLCACKALCFTGRSTESSAYYLGDDYYLTLFSAKESGAFASGCAGTLSDFGENIGSAEGSLILERAVCFCKKDAVKRLSEI